MKILITDDAKFMRMMLSTIVVKAGHTFIEAANGKEAIALYEREQPDIVTMDITMPEMDGISAVKQIMQKHPTAKIVMCSAMGQQAMVLEAIQAGAKDFIVKPFQEDKVLATIAKLA